MQANVEKRSGSILNVLSIVVMTHCSSTSDCWDVHECFLSLSKTKGLANWLRDGTSAFGAEARALLYGTARLRRILAKSFESV